MNLTQKYETREELLKAVEDRIEQDSDAMFYLVDLKEKNDRLAQEIEQSKKYRIRAQEAECKVKECERQLASQTATIDELNQLNPRQLQEKIKEYTIEKGTLLAENEKLQVTVEVLLNELNAYHVREEENKIEEELVKMAEHFGIRKEAHRDVLRLAPLFHINEQGEVRTADDLTVEQVVLHEKELSPHWLPVSLGGGCRAGNAKVTCDDRYAEAREARNLSAMLLNAPVLE
ncbi:MAG: hypothetical protein Q4G68_14860 [Planctomycetia bacterium]|nr:hypothetical protein [Planctomycetia bacterium]